MGLSHAEGIEGGIQTGGSLTPPFMRLKRKLKVELKPKWKKVGVCRISTSKKVILLAIFELEAYRWLVVDVGELLELIAGHRFDVPIFERDLTA